MRYPIPYTVAFVVACGCQQAKSSATAETESARAFVQEFYDRYAPHADTSSAPAYWRVLGEGNVNLTDSLATALRSDSAARVQSSSGRESLNFDPFLASQDPCSRYEAREVDNATGGYVVTIHPVCSDPQWQKGTHRVAVVPVSGRWRIANVQYESTDLLTTLCEYIVSDKREQCRQPK